MLMFNLDNIHASDKMLEFADKTTNLYEMDSDYYRNLLNDNENVQHS